MRTIFSNVNLKTKTQSMRCRKVVLIMILFGILLMGSSTVYGIVITVDDSGQYDFKTLYSMGRFLRTYKDSKAILFSDKKTYTLKVGEPVYIVAHGAPGIIGEKGKQMNGSDIAKALIRLLDFKNLTKIHIYVISCNAGTVYEVSGSSLVSDIYDNLISLKKRKVKRYVGGPDGCAIVDVKVKPPLSIQIIDKKCTDCFCIKIQKPLEDKIPKKDKDPATYKKIKELDKRAATAFKNKEIIKFYEELFKDKKYFYKQGTHITTCEDK